MSSRALRYLSSADVSACLPPITRQVELAREALEALATNDAEMPPKVGVHPRHGALLHAMPAWLRSKDLVGVKWVSAYPGNAVRGVPAIQGVIVLNDADAGTPLCVMDAAAITAARTAAVSGVALHTFVGNGARRAAILGAGVQARSHAAVLRELLPEIELTIFDRHPERASALAGVLGGASNAPAARDAVDGADVIVTAGAIGTQQQMTPDWVKTPALVIAVDFSGYVSAALANRAATFAVDDRAQFEAYRSAGYFEGYPDPTVTLGEVARGDVVRTTGHVVVTHLGVGTADVLFANEVRRVAESRGIGIDLPR